MSPAIAASVLAFAAAAAAAGEGPREPRKPARVYTNEDLERVHPFAGQTGAGSLPAVPLDQRDEPRRDEPRGRGEAWWRDEAARVRERVRALEERAAGLRAKIVRERSRESPVYGRKGSSARPSQLEPLQASLAALERRIRATQDDLEDRARRDGALPGWIR